MEFHLTFGSKPIDYKNIISAIVQFCIESEESMFIYSFYPEGFPVNDDNQLKIILRGEYEIMQGIIKTAIDELGKIQPNKNIIVWDGYDVDKYHLYRTAMIATKSDFDQLESNGESLV